MQYCSILEAWGVDSLDIAKKEDLPQRSVAFSNTIAPRGNTFDTHDVDEIEPSPCRTYERPPAKKTITTKDVKKFITATYRTKGILAVWKLLDRRARRRIVLACQSDISRWFDSTENILVSLALMFVFLLIIDDYM
jgi:hypothetical protein